MDTKNSEGKIAKKSSTQQLQCLVEFMENNHSLARGAPVFGGSKESVEAKWESLTVQLNALGPPMRTISEWKKTWADMKSRTKKKIAENNRSLRQTGGGIFSSNTLTPMEEQIDRICCLSSAAAPKGKTFGERTEEEIDDVFQISYEQIETPPRKKKDVAVVTPNRLERSQEYVVTPDERKSEKRLREDENNMSSTYKKRKSFADEQLNLIRMQLKSSEEAVLAAKENANAAREISNAAKEIATCAKEMAISNKILASAAEKIASSAENSVKAIKELSLRLKDFLDNDYQTGHL